MTVGKVVQHSTEWSWLSIKAVVDQLEALLEQCTAGGADPALCARMGEQLRALHARVRAHYAVQVLSERQQMIERCAPHLTERYQQLQADLPRVISQLDRAVRMSEWVGESDSEEQTVFVLRVREVMVTLQRFKAEETLVLARAVWSDTGGES